MILSSGFFMVVAAALAPFLYGVTLPLVGFFFTTLVIGVVRLIPAVDRSFGQIRGALIP